MVVTTRSGKRLASTVVQAVTKTTRAKRAARTTVAVLRAKTTTGGGVEESPTTSADGPPTSTTSRARKRTSKKVSKSTPKKAKATEIVAASETEVEKATGISMGQTKPKPQKSVLSDAISSGNDILHSLPSDCIEAKLMCRPSKRNRSPYVADIFVPSLDREAICHVPNLDMGGKCVPGATLLVKPQRDKKGNLLGPDAVNPKYNTPKCEFVAQLLRVDESNLDERYTPTWVGAHPSLGEIIAEKLIERHMSGLTHLPGMEKLTAMKKQVTIKDGTRADFVLEQESGKKHIVEVKTVVDTDYCSSWQLPERSKCVFTSDTLPYQRTGIFPWGNSNQKGPDGEKVVSARAIKHVRELTEFVEKGTYDATILFIVIRGDAEAFRANKDSCPSFARYLKEAESKGVKVLAKRVKWGEKDGEVGQCFEDKWIDVDWP